MLPRLLDVSKVLAPWLGWLVFMFRALFYSTGYIDVSIPPPFLKLYFYTAAITVSCLSLVNHYSIPTSECFGSRVESLVQVAWITGPHWYNAPLLILSLQLLLLPILARFALTSVKRYRQAAE